MKIGVILFITYIVCGIIGQILFLIDDYSDFSKIDKETFGFSLYILCAGWFGFASMLLIIIGRKFYKIISSWIHFDSFLEKIEIIISKFSKRKNK